MGFKNRQINFKNLAENLIVVIISVSVGGLVGYYASNNTAKHILSSQESIINKAIDKNTSEITNTFKNEFKKVKNKKGESINIVIDPSTNSVITSDTSKVVTVDEKKGFFKRLLRK